MKGSVGRRGKVFSSDFSCGGSNDDLEQRQRDQRYAFQLELELFDQEEAQLGKESQRRLHQMMEGWDAFPWLRLIENQLAPVPGGVGTIGDGAINELPKHPRRAFINRAARSGAGTGRRLA